MSTAESRRTARRGRRRWTQASTTISTSDSTAGKPSGSVQFPTSSPICGSPIVRDARNPTTAARQTAPLTIHTLGLSTNRIATASTMHTTLSMMNSHPM